MAHLAGKLQLNRPGWSPFPAHSVLLPGTRPPRDILENDSQAPKSTRLSQESLFNIVQALQEEEVPGSLCGGQRPCSWSSSGVGNPAPGEKRLGKESPPQPKRPSPGRRLL